MVHRSDSGQLAAVGESHAHAGATGAIQAGDWRGSGSAKVPARTIEPRAEKIGRAAVDPLHLRARAAPLREERTRARDIIHEGKTAVETAFAAIQSGEKLEITKLSPIVDAIAASVARNPIAIPGITRLKDRHEYTYLHSVSVCGLMLGLAKSLGLDSALTYDIGLAGLLHDIGKARVPTLLLDKPGPLTAAEFRVVQTHTERGLDLLIRTGGIPQIARDVCVQHHERIDGSGYPYGLSGDRLSIYARMASICDVYDAVTSARSYKHGWSPSEALEFMGAAEGHFDRRILAAFTAMIGIFPVGALVRLESGRLAVVLDEADVDPVEPPVAAFFCAIKRRPIEWRRCDPKSDPIVGIERPDRWGFPDWNRLRAEVLAHFAKQL